MLGDLKGLKEDKSQLEREKHEYYEVEIRNLRAAMESLAQEHRESVINSRLANEVKKPISLRKFMASQIPAFHVGLKGHDIGPAAAARGVHRLIRLISPHQSTIFDRFVKDSLDLEN